MTCQALEDNEEKCIYFCINVMRRSARLLTTSTLSYCFYQYFFIRVELHFLTKFRFELILFSVGAHSSFAFMFATECDKIDGNFSVFFGESCFARRELKSRKQTYKSSSSFMKTKLNLSFFFICLQITRIVFNFMYIILSYVTHYLSRPGLVLIKRRKQLHNHLLHTLQLSSGKN